jgi:hypothetical protein
MRLSWTAAIGLLVATARLRHRRAKSIKSLKVIAGVAKATGQSHTVHPDGWPAGAARRAQSPRRRPRGVPLPHEPGRAPAVRSREEMIPAPIRQRRSGDGCSAVISLPSLSPMLETEWSTFTGGASGARRERREGVTDGVWCGAPYRLALPQKRAPCSSASRTNRRLPDLRCGRIREHDHTSAPASCAFIVVRTLLRLFGVHGANVGVGGRQRIDQHCVPGPLAQRSAANCGLLNGRCSR